MLRRFALAPALLLAAALALSGCGNTVGDRGFSGAGIGAAAGTAIGAVTGLTIVQGALIGAGAGGLIGAVTDEEDFNLGKPWWK